MKDTSATLLTRLYSDLLLGVVANNAVDCGVCGCARGERVHALICAIEGRDHTESLDAQSLCYVGSLLLSTPALGLV